MVGRTFGDGSSKFGKSIGSYIGKSKRRKEGKFLRDLAMKVEDVSAERIDNSQCNS
jgi:hypothetical protein